MEEVAQSKKEPISEENNHEKQTHKQIFLTKRSSTISAYSRREEISVDAIRNPFLLSVHNVELSARRLLGRTRQLRHIGAGAWKISKKKPPKQNENKNKHTEMKNYKKKRKRKKERKKAALSYPVQ
jgi:hypothetical protein